MALIVLEALTIGTLLTIAERLGSLVAEMLGNIDCRPIHPREVGHVD